MKEKHWMSNKYPYKHFARDMTYTEFAEVYCNILSRWLKEQRVVRYELPLELIHLSWRPNTPTLDTDYKNPDSLISQLSDLVDNHPDYEKQFDDTYHEKHDTQFKQALVSVGLS